jgi:hypothetical protein
MKWSKRAGKKRRQIAVEITISTTSIQFSIKRYLEGLFALLQLPTNSLFIAAAHAILQVERLI